MRDIIRQRLGLEIAVGTAEKRHEDDVASAIAREPRGLSLNDIGERFGGSVSETSRTLMSLESQGRARFQGGRWSAPLRHVLGS